MRRSRPAPRLHITCLWLVALAAPGQATDTERRFGPWIWGLSGGAVHQFDAGFNQGPGEFSVSRGYVQASVGYARDRRNSVSVALGAGHSHYDFSREASIEGRTPWENVRDYRLSVPIRFAASERSNVIIIPSVRVNSESGASHSDGMTEGLLAGASWTVSESLSIGPGFGWFSELGGGSDAFPILLIDWKITEKLSLGTGGGLAASQGPGLTLDYRFNRQWKLGLTGRYEKIRFALDDGAAGPGGVGEDRSLPLLLLLEYSPWPMTSISAMVGAEFDGRLRIEDDSGRPLAQSEFDTAPVIGLTFSSRF